MPAIMGAKLFSQLSKVRVETAPNMSYHVYAWKKLTATLLQEPDGIGQTPANLRSKMIIGFTGTRQGMTEHQVLQFRKFLNFLQPNEFHHGDCTGADYNAQVICKKEQAACRIILHPPLDLKHQAFCSADIKLEPAEYMKRNAAIVAACDLLIATPAGPEVLRSGTWATIRMALKAGVNVLTILPRK